MTRWWAPAGASIGPDEQDFTLLQTLGQPKADLGSALLALHRVGAAACEAVALSPVPSEITLIETVAKARSVFAAPMVESVSKSVETPHYADLLVRDVFDEAEQGALDVFSTCVSKGVPASMAAQRAGLVYGVPPDGLGHYKSLAVELRAHPAALQDAADRALFEHFEKVADEEFSEQWEEVSKAPGDERTRVEQDLFPDAGPDLFAADDPQTPYHDARDTRGRFARGSQGGPPVVGEPKQRMERRTRLQRKERKEPVATPLQRKLVRSAEHMKAKQLSRQKLKREPMMLRKTAEEAAAEAPPLPTPPALNDPALMARVPGAIEIGTQLTSETAVAFSREEWAEMQGKMGKAGEFRMGNVVRGKDANYFTRAEGAHQARLKNYAFSEIQKLEDAGIEYDLPITAEVSREALAGVDPDLLWEYAHGIKFDAVADWMFERGLDPYADSELRDELIKNMKLPMDAEDSDAKMTFSVPPPSRPGVSRPLIGVIEVVFLNPLGFDEGSEANPDLAYDDNQVMELVNSRPQVVYDPAVGANRLRYYARPKTDNNGNIIKADNPATEFFDNRDRGGRFAIDTRRGQLIPTDTPALIPEDAVETRPARKERKGRIERKIRREPVVARYEKKPTRASRRSLKRSQARKINFDLQRQRLQKAKAQPKPSSKPSPELSMHHKYAVMSQVDLKRIAKDEGMKLGDTLYDSGVKFSLMGQQVDGRDADFMLRDQNYRDIMGEEYGAQSEPVELKRGPLRLKATGTEIEQTAAIFEYAEDLFAQNPDIQQLSVDYFADKVQFWANKNPSPPVVLIEHQDKLDTGKPMKLEYQGMRNYDDFVPDFDEPFEAKEMRAIRGELEMDEDFDPMDDDYAWVEGDDVLDDVKKPITLNRPQVEHYRLVNVDPTTDSNE